MDELITIPYDRVRTYWPIVREGLLEVVKRTNPDWIPEDVYVSLRSNESRLVVGLHNDRFVGFAVVLDRRGPFDSTHALIVWAIWLQHGTDFETLILKLKESALRDGYDKIMFQSPRRGWIRRLWRHDFHPRETIFECNLRSSNAGTSVRSESIDKH